MNNPVINPNVAQPQVSWQAAVDHAQQSPTLWQRFTELFSPRTTSVTQVVDTEDAFKNHFHTEVARLAQHVPDAQLERFLGRAQQHLDDIISASLGKAYAAGFSSNTGELRETQLNQAIRAAYSQSVQALEVLDKVAHILAQDPPDTCPQLERHPSGGFVLIRSAPQIENLVMKGGGGKGLGNPPALIELERAGMLGQVKQLVGTSAGALSAALLASGTSPSAFQALSNTLDIGALAKQPLDTNKYPGIEFGTGLKQAGGILATIDQLTATSVADHLNTHWQDPAFQAKFTALPPADQTRLSLLRTHTFNGNRTQQMITFNDLRLMHQLAPDTFKELTLTGFNDTDKTLQYFNAQTTPNMPVALAGRISMSIPLFFQAVRYDIGDGNGVKQWTDGGVGSNMPAGAVLDGLQGEALDNARARTLLMTFDEQGSAYKTLHGGEAEYTRGANWKERWLGGNPNMDAVRRDDRVQTHNAGPNAFVVFHGDLGTFDLSPTEERLDQAQHQSRLKTLEFIEQRMNQAYSVHVSSVDEAVLLMSDDERQQFLDRYH